MLAGVWATLLLLAGASDIDSRIAAAAAAAQALHGPLDGTWALRDNQGRVLYVIQIVDPVSGQGDLQAAWRNPSEPDRGSDLGVVTRIKRERQSLVLAFAPPDGPVSVTLAGGGGERWTGRMERQGRPVSVSLTRYAPGARR